MTPRQLLASSDWADAFKEAMGTYTHSKGNDNGPTPPTPVAGYTGSTALFSVDDVAEIIATSEQGGERLEMNLVGAFRLEDGRFALVRASCNDGGWMCLASGDAVVAATFEDLYRLALDKYERDRLGFCGWHEDCSQSPDIGRACRAAAKARSSK